MTAKEYLSQLWRKNAKINSLLARQQRYRELASRSTAVYRDIPGGGQSRASSTEEYVCKIVDLEREIDRRIDEYVDLTREIEGRIRTLEDERYRAILCFRYINEWSWVKIAQEMNYSLDWVWELHGRALRKFSRIFKEPSKTQF